MGSYDGDYDSQDYNLSDVFVSTLILMNFVTFLKMNLHCVVLMKVQFD